MGDCFLAAGRPQEARAAFEKAERLKSDKALLAIPSGPRTGQERQAGRSARRPWRLLLPSTCTTRARRRTKRWPTCWRSWARRTSCSTGWKNSAPPSRPTRRWAIIWPANIGRPARSTRPRPLYVALLKTAARAGRLPRPGRNLSAGQTLRRRCWRCWAACWKRPACWKRWGPSRKPSPATPT